MLEKITFCDAHFHFSACKPGNFNDFSDNQTGCSSCHSLDDLKALSGTEGFALSFGIHPQNPDNSLLCSLETLLEEKKINAVGECGYDLFTEDFKAELNKQKFVFEAQLELALKYNIPMVIHCRKANHLLFPYAKELKKLPGVLFHSFMGSLVEAESLVSRGINCYFSFGKQIFNNNKKVIQIVHNLPVENLLLETDAPFQFLKGETGTFMSEIESVYKGAYSLKKENLQNTMDFAGFCECLKQNYINLYMK